VLAWSDLGVAAGETWFYQVAAVNAVDTGARSNEVSATVPFPPDPPSAPTLSATAGNASVTLNWTAPTDDGGADVTNYEIYRSTTAGAAAYLTTVGDVQTFTDTGPTNGTTYYYQVAAINSAGTGARSNEASAQPTAPITVPSAPRQLKAQKVQGGIRLTWLAPTSNGGSPLTAYRVYRSGGPQSVVWTLLPGNLTFTDTTVAPRTYYGYAVRAVNVAGESAASNVVLVKTQ
jgi:predicted phage tail protein